MKKKESISVTLAVIIGLALGGCSQSMASSNREASSNVQIQAASTSKNRILTTGITLESSEAEMNKQEGSIMKITVLSCGHVEFEMLRLAWSKPLHCTLSGSPMALSIRAFAARGTESAEGT